MLSSFLLTLLPLLLSLTTLSTAQSGYTGYSRTSTGDPDSAVYETADTPANVSTTNPPPDVYLNASLHVGEIDITVKNLTAKINLSAEVLSLLKFNAGVDASIDRVHLGISNISAQVTLEARLANLVMMIDDVLSSLDLNPTLATLGQDVGQIVNTTVGGLTGSGSGGSSSTTTGSNSTSTLSRRSYELANNILYSINDYSGNTHTNRILAQDGSIVDQYLDNDDHITGQKVVGSFATDMTFNGYSREVTRNGQAEKELEYVYAPFHGLSVVSAVFVSSADEVVGTQVLAESGAGGTSTIS